MQNRSKEHLLMSQKEMLSCRPQLNIKEIKILIESDFLEDIKVGIKTVWSKNCWT